MAKLYFRYGTMNSGKTTALLQVAYNYEEQGMKVVIIKPLIDTKGNNNIVSRIGISRKVNYLVDPKQNIYNLIKKKGSIDCILIDEAQFLTIKQVSQLMKIVVILNIPVICYGLRTDFKTRGFPGSIRLLEIAHSIEEIKTICKCGKKALYNARLVNGAYTTKGIKVAIDGENKITYEPMCPRCYFDKVR